MPVLSYLAYPIKGAKSELINELTGLEFCQVMPAENEDVLILVTDTPDDTREKELQDKLKNIESLQSLGMTFGHADEQAEG